MPLSLKTKIRKHSSFWVYYKRKWLRLFRGIFYGLDTCMHCKAGVSWINRQIRPCQTDVYLSYCSIFLWTSAMDLITDGGHSLISCLVNLLLCFDSLNGMLACPMVCPKTTVCSLMWMLYCQMLIWYPLLEYQHSNF